MAINLDKIVLEKGQRINLEKGDGSKMTNFCVGCNWGAITKKTFFGLGSTTFGVDLDLSSVLVDRNGKMIDHIYSPQYRREFLASYGMPAG